MVILVALVLAGAATLLRPLQERNMRIEKMQNILSVIQVDAPRAEAEALFERYITQAMIVNNRGEEIEGDAFEVDLQDENRKPEAERLLPVFIAGVNGETFYIVPVRGAGLWGPIWGYIGLRDDMTTLVGANFDHASETPGLGAEISESAFENQFNGKKIYDELGQFRPVRVVKGRAPAGDPHAVDGITGGTITSNGVTNMIRDGLMVYDAFFKKTKSQ